MGTRIIIPNADFSRNGLPLEKNIVFLLGAGETARVLMGLTVGGFQPAVAPEGTVEEIVYNQDVVSRYYGFNLPDNISSLCSVLSKESESGTINDGIKDIIFNNIPGSMLISLCKRCYATSVTLNGVEMTSTEAKFDTFAQYSRISGSIDLSGITYKNAVTQCNGMFHGAILTKQIYIPNMYRIRTMTNMFNSCSSLEYIDMSNCSMESTIYSASYHTGIFNSSPKLSTIKVVGCNDAFNNFIIARLASAGYVFYKTTDAGGNAVLCKDVSGWTATTYDSGTTYTTWNNTTDPADFTATGTYNIVISDGTNNYYFTKTVL